MNFLKQSVKASCMVLFLIILVSKSQLVSGGKYSTGLLGSWQLVLTPNQVGGPLAYYYNLEIKCTSDSKGLDIIGYRGPIGQNLARPSYQKEGIYPIRGWVRNAKIVFPTLPCDWDFKYDEENDIILADCSCRGTPIGLYTYRLTFKRNSYGLPCDEIEEPKEGNDDVRWRGERPNESQRPRRGPDNSSGDEQRRQMPPKARTQSGTEDCTPKIIAIYITSYPGPYSSACGLEIQGKCFPMNFQLWVDGHIYNAFEVRYEGESRLKTWAYCSFTNPRAHYFQIKDVDAGRKSNIHEIWY
jgi:hypothetical protein